MADYDCLDKGQDDGAILGKTSSREIGFWGVCKTYFAICP